MQSREQVGRSVAGTREDAMGIMLGNWTRNARCVSTLAPGDAVPHIQMPIGWLEMLRRGFLHRDVSIGNILMVDPPVTMKPFEVQTIEQLMTQLSLENVGEINKDIGLLEGAIKNVGHMDEWHGFVIDGDMAARLEGYFTSRDTGEVSVSIGLVLWESN